MIRINLVAAVVVMAVIAGCSKAESSPDQSSAAPAAAAAPTKASAGTIDLCSLVTQAEAESILGMKLEPPQKQKGGDCWYLRQGGSDFGAVELILSVPTSVRSEKEFDELVTSSTQSMNDNLKSAGVQSAAFSLKKAEGVGAPAYFIDPGLYVLKGHRVLAVGLGGDKGVAIAKIAVQRMP